jgi:hypothetical protein
MRISKKLNLVIPIYGDEADKDAQPTCYVHATPIAQDVFEQYYEVIGKAFNKIHEMGLMSVSSVRLSSLVIRDVAQRDGVWDGATGVQMGLVNEMDRLTNVFMPTDRGWSMLPLEDALKTNLFTDEDAAEVRNAVAFFTLMSTIVRRRELPTLMVIALKLWGARLESSSGMEFQGSLPTLTGTAATPRSPAVASSVPS